MHKITKRFNGYPFAHRQHTHDGHCKLIHGHNWDFEINMAADKLDKNGFVYDFGKFGWLKEWFEKMFDHTCLINRDDPELELFKSLGTSLQTEPVLDLKIVESCSSEGLAKLVFEKINSQISKDPRLAERGVVLKSVVVYEDYKNSAAYFGNATVRWTNQGDVRYGGGE